MATETDMHEHFREVMHRMTAVTRKHHTAFDALRAETGLGRSAHYTLMRLSDANDAMSQTDIASMLEISTAAVCGMLKKLEADGFVTRQPNPSDTRANEIALTDKGQQIVARSRERFSALDAAVFGGFTAEEVTMLYSCLDRMQNNLDALSEQAKGRKEETL